MHDDLIRRAEALVPKLRYMGRQYAAGSLQTNDKRIPGHGSRNRRPDFGIHGDADMWKTAADAFRLIPPFELEPT